MSEAVLFPAGTYYIGDLVYVGQDFWEELCNTLDSQETEQELNILSDGRRIWLSYTTYGDGSYTTNTSYELSVDSGTLGIISLNDIVESEKKFITCGMVKTFLHDFFVSKEGMGVFYFGSEISVDSENSECYYSDDLE